MSEPRKTPHTLHTQIPDGEIDALRLSSEGADCATALALLVGIRYAMRSAHRRDRQANPHPYGPCRLSHRDIAGAALCSVPTVKRWLPLLETAGVVATRPLFSPKGDQLASEYSLPFSFPSVQNEPTPQLKMIQGVSSRSAEEVSYLRRYIDTKDTSIASAPPPPGDAELFTEPTPSATGPRKTEIGDRPPKAARPRNELCDTLATATGRNPHEMTAPEARACAVALANIRKVCPDLTSAEIEFRAGNYRRAYPKAAISPHAVANHWSELGRTAPKAPSAERVPVN